MSYRLRYSARQVRCMGTPLFSRHFYVGNSYCDFLFAFLDSVALLKWGLLLKQRICSCRSKFFALRVDPIDKEGKDESDRLTSPESVNSHLKDSKSTLNIQTQMSFLQCHFPSTYSSCHTKLFSEVNVSQTRQDPDQNLSESGLGQQCLIKYFCPKIFWVISIYFINVY